MRSNKETGLRRDVESGFSLLVVLVMEYISGCEAKIRRAESLIKELTVKSEQAIKDSNYQVEKYIDPENRRYVFELNGPEPPLELSVITGEIAHNLRSVLDYLVWGVSKQRSSKIMFPVCDKAENYRNAVKRLKRLDGVPNEYKKLIEIFQPYNQVKPERSVIKLINELNVLDKHRLLLVTKNVVAIGHNIKLCGNPKCEYSIIVDPKHWFFHAHENGKHLRYVKYEPKEVGGDWWIENDCTVEYTLSIDGEYNHEPILPIMLELINGIKKVVSLWRAVTI